MRSRSSSSARRACLRPRQPPPLRQFSSPRQAASLRQASALRRTAGASARATLLLLWSLPARRMPARPVGTIVARERALIPGDRHQNRALQFSRRCETSRHSIDERQRSDARFVNRLTVRARPLTIAR